MVPIQNLTKKGFVVIEHEQVNLLGLTSIIKTEHFRSSKKNLPEGTSGRHGKKRAVTAWQKRGGLSVKKAAASRGFPAGSVVKNNNNDNSNNHPPANAADTGSSPDLGRSHMPWSDQAHESQRLSLCSLAQEPTCRNYWSPCAPEPMLLHEKPVHCN